MQIEPALFSPNNHSKWLVEYRPVDLELQKEIQNVIDNYYSRLFNSSSIINIEQVDEAEVNSNNFRITTREDKYLLRRFPPNRIANNTLAIYEIIEYLKNNGLKVPIVIPSKDNEKLVCQNGVLWSLFELLPNTHYKGTLNELKSAGREIGKLDKLLNFLPSQEEIKTLVVFPQSYINMREYSREIWFDIFNKADNKKDSFSERLLSMKSFILDCIDCNPCDLCLPKQFVHFDLHPHNLLADGERVVAILDFDSVRYVEKMRAIAFAIHRLVRQCIVFNCFPITEVKKLCNIFIEEYLKEDTLADDEIISIPYFIRNEAMCRLSYIAQSVYRDNTDKWEGDFDKQILSIAESVYF